MGWGAGVSFIAFITMAFFNSFDQPDIDNILSTVPDSLKPLVGAADTFKTIPGYIGQQIFGPNGYILVLVASIIMAIAVSASEEDDKRLQTLLTLPVTRAKVFCHKWAAVMTSVAVVCLALVVGMYFGLLVAGHSADSGRVMQSTFACFLMAGSFASIAFGVAMFLGNKGLSITIASGYAAFSFIISSLAQSVDALKSADKLSVLHYYNNPLVMQHGLDFRDVFILIGIILIVSTIGWFRFKNRNIGV